MSANLEELPSTGFAGFDVGLRAIFGVDEASVAKVVQKANGNIGEIAANLSEDFLRGAIALENEDLFERVTRAHPRQLVPIVTQAREITRRLLGPIVQTPEKREELERLLPAPSGDDQQTWADLGVFRGLDTQSEWVFDSGEVTPRLRLVVYSFKDRVILNSPLDWDDVIFIAYRLIQALRDDFGNLDLLSEEARKTINMKSEFGDRIAKRMSNISKDVKVIRDRLKTLGFSDTDFDIE